MRLDHRRIFLALVLALSGCSAASAEEAGPPSRPPPPPKVRSYETPEAPMSAEEKADILALCSGLVACQKQRLPLDQSCPMPVEGKTKWGKLIAKYAETQSFGTVGRHTARLLQAEDMKWASADCREVVKRFGNRYQ